MSADRARVGDGARGSGRIARRAAGRNEGERDGNSEIALPAWRAGVAPNRGDACRIQSAGKRSGEIPGFGGSALAAGGGRERGAAKEYSRARGLTRAVGGGSSATTVTAEP